MLGLRNPFRKSKPAAPPMRLNRIVRTHGTTDGEGVGGGVGGERRWDGGKTDRLNSGKWTGANGLAINVDLASYLTVLRNRCHLEIAKNPYVEGVIQTHIIDICGENGPTLQVQSDDDDYNAALEALWREWFAMPDINGQLTGVDFLRLNIRSCWPNGEFVNQKVTDPGAVGGVKLRLMAIDPRRLDSPWSTLAPKSDDGSEITLGVKRSKTGKPLSYFIGPAIDSAWGGLGMMQKPAEIPARDIIHGFEMSEPGQARGLPWLAVSLEGQSDLREYDNQTLDSARLANDFSATLTNENADATALDVNSSVEIERRRITAMPPGWKVSQLAPNQPSSQYVEYRAARLAELGRAVNMPLMMVTLNSAEHNYSSARFDGQIYQRGNVVKQSWLTRVMLEPCLNEIIVEAELAGLLDPRPAKLKFVWTWPKAPHVDPAKEATAETVRMANGTLTLASACAAHGLDWEQVIEQRKREKAALEAAGLPLGPADVVAAAAITANAAADADEEKETAADKAKGTSAAPAPNRIAPFLNGNHRQ